MEGELELSAAKDTLRYQLGARPLYLHRDMSGVSCKSVSDAMNKFMGSSNFNGDVQPEHEALTFYMLDHAVADIRRLKHLDEPLEGMLPIMELVNATTAEMAARALYYLILICTRESRHLHNLNDLSSRLAKNYGQAVVDFNDHLGGGSSGAAGKFRHAPPDATIGDFVSSLRMIFYQGNFSGGYGGPNWGKVTDCLVEFVYGRYSAAMMLDTIWTLCHNNGPIFNKGMLYSGYSNELVRILDVQRSGQIPQLIKDGHVFATPNHHEWLELCYAELEGAFGGYVDWYLVEALGSNNKYPSEKKAQVEKHGMPENVKEMEDSTFEVMPGMALKKFKIVRKQEAA